jgi:glycosyltransferase involved in cell wall biosynthesis
MKIPIFHLSCGQEVKKSMDYNKKVLHVIGGGEFGGAEQHIIQLLSQLPLYGVKGKVVCFYEAEFAKALRKQGVDVEVLHFGRFDFRLLSGLKEVFLREQPDIIHTHGVKANFFGRLAARKLSNIPLVTTIHSILRFDYTNDISYFAASRMERWTRLMNHHFIAISHSIKQSLLHDGVPPEKITVVHHGINTEEFDKGKPKLREELSLSSESYLIGVVSRLVKMKGIQYIVEAMPRILGANPSAHLVIVGSGPYEAELKNLSTELGLERNVHFVGFRKDIPDCLHSFDCFVSASLSEGLGLNVLEAMSASLPVVVTGVGGILDFTEDRENGLIAETRSHRDLADKILELMENKDLAIRLAQEAKQRVEQHFSIEAMSTNTIQVYERLLGADDV